MAKFLKKPAFLKIPTFDLPKLSRKPSQVAGLPPGTPVYIGEPRTEPVKITSINYDKKHFEEATIPSADEWQYGYVVTWLVMIAIAVAMLVFFRRKKWL